MISNVMFYSAIVLFLGSAAGLGYTFNRIIKVTRKLELFDIFRKNSGLLGGFSVLLGLSLVFFTVAFFTSGSSLVASPKVGDLILSYVSAFYLGLSTGLFACFFFFRFWVTKFDEKTKRFIQWSMAILGASMFVFFILNGVANGSYLAYPLCNAIYIGKHGIAFVNTHVAPAPYFVNGSADGGLTIAFYALFILSGALGVFALCDHLMFKNYGHHGLVTTCFFIAFPMGIVGARLWYCILDITKCAQQGITSIYLSNPIEILKVWNGGLGIMGGAILGIISGVIVMLVYKYGKKDEKYVKINYLRIVDFIVPTILIAQAVGRIGNFFNTEVHGNEIPLESLNWLPYFIRNNYTFDGKTACTPGMVYLPLSLMESITNLVGYFVLYFLFYKGMHQYHIEGSNTGFYLMWYGATRAIMEPLRFGEYKYDFSYMFSYVMIGAGALLVVFFGVWKYLREHHLLMYKNRTPVDGCLLTIEAPKKVVLRNLIITISILVLIAVVTTVLLVIY